MGRAPMWQHPKEVLSVLKKIFIFAPYIAFLFLVGMQFWSLVFQAMK